MQLKQHAHLVLVMWTSSFAMLSVSVVGGLRSCDGIASCSVMWPKIVMI